MTKDEKKLLHERATDLYGADNAAESVAWALALSHYDLAGADSAWPAAVDNVLDILDDWHLAVDY